MTEPITVKGVYENGVIRLDTPTPALHGMIIELTIGFPEGEAASQAQSKAQATAKAHYPGPVIELGINLAHFSQGEKPQLVPLIREFRQRLEEATGFRLPSVRMIVREEMDKDGYNFILNATKIAAGTIQHDMLMAISPDPDDKRDMGLLGEPIINEPAFGLPGCWISPRRSKRAQELGLTVVPAVGIMASHFEETIFAHLPECLDRDSVHKLVEETRGAHPKLVVDMVPAMIDITELHMLLRALLKRKANISAMEIILQGIDEYEGDEDDLEGMADYIATTLPGFGQA